MSGIPMVGIESETVHNLRPHYEPVLRQHIEQVFLEGYQAGQTGGPLGVPVNNRVLPTPRGSLESWLPLHHLTSLYQIGADFAAKRPEDLLRLQQTLDQVTAMLYARTGLTLEEPYSRTLLVHPESGTEATAIADGVPPALAAPAPPELLEPLEAPLPVAQPAEAAQEPQPANA